MAELVDAPDSKSGFFGSASSILALGTKHLTSSNIKSTSENFKIVSDSLSPLINSNNGEPIDLNKIENMPGLALANSKQLVKITENLNQFSYDTGEAEHLSMLLAEHIKQIDLMLAQQMKEVDMRVAEHRDNVFERATILVLIFSIIFPIVFFPVTY